MIAWALLAATDPARLAAVAAAAWESASDGGEPPPMQTRRLADGRAAVTGDEPGLGGLFDRWAGALAARLGLAVLALDLDPEVDEQHAASADGAVATSAGARAVAQAVGLLPPARARNRSLLVVEGVAPAKVVAALSAALRVAALPPTVRVTEHTRGTLVAASPPGMGPSVLARHLAGLGAVWSFVWGPTTHDLLVTWTRAEGAGHVRWPAGTGEGDRPAAIAALDAAGVMRAFAVADPADAA